MKNLGSLKTKNNYWEKPKIQVNVEEYHVHELKDSKLFTLQSFPIWSIVRHNYNTNSRMFFSRNWKKLL